MRGFTVEHIYMQKKTFKCLFAWLEEIQTEPKTTGLYAPSAGDRQLIL